MDGWIGSKYSLCSSRFVVATDKTRQGSGSGSGSEADEDLKG